VKPTGKPAKPAGKAAVAPVVLLDGNVLVALVSASHVHHQAAQRWFAHHHQPFATCPITQGTLLRLSMHLGGIGAETALDLLKHLTAHPRHRFWADTLGYTDFAWRGVMGHRQVTDAYLAALARHHAGKLASFDRGLVALHSDVAVAIDTTG
jgi:uncharacterized protein